MLRQRACFASVSTCVQQTSFEEVDGKRNAYWRAEQARIILEQEFLINPDATSGIFPSLSGGWTFGQGVAIILAPGGWSMVSLVFATPAFIMWLQLLEWEVLLVGVFDREDAHAFKPVALACVTLCWFISERYSPGLVVPKIRCGPEHFGTYLHVLSLEDPPSGAEQEYNLTSFPFKQDPGDGAPAVAIGELAHRENVPASKADVEKLMAQNVQLMNAMMQQQKKLEIQEEITTKLMQQITAGAGSTTTAPPEQISSHTTQFRQSLAKPGN